MDIALIGLLDLSYTIATLALSAAGLALVFGLMRVINLAHGEFIVLGGYATIVAQQWGCNIWVAMLLVAPLTVGVYGLVLERLVIQWLYGRTIATMLATWGLSLATSGALSMVFGTSTTGVDNPLGSIDIGQYRVAGYGLFIVVLTILLFVLLYLVLRCTRAGLIVRAAMQSADVTATLGHAPKTVYLWTFVVGSMLSGLAGGVLSPLVGITPTAGGQFIAKAFITVISGGAAVVAGTVSASALLGTVAKVFELLATPVVGEIALLLAAIVLLRLMPQGISARWLRGKT